MTQRDLMVQRLMLELGLSREAAVQTEARWFDAAWSASLSRNDADHAACDHNDRTFRRVYKEHVDGEFSSPR